MKPIKQAKRYAKMFINVVGMNAALQSLSELTAIEHLMNRSGEVRSLLLNPGFSQTERESAIRKIAEKAKLSENVVKFVIFLTENRVIAALSEIVKTATAIYLEKMKQAKAVVFTPVEVSKGHEERLKASLKKLLDRDVDIEYVMDPTLLGGILVKVGSTMYDSSVKGQLRLLKDELIKG
ncbi:MAG: ATP synthase F1 subunit delta [Nitrospirota bacterium]|nr:ATP synthase F1 subunit delta [Nitrospirota bacterium]